MLWMHASQSEMWRAVQDSALVWFMFVWSLSL